MEGRSLVPAFANQPIEREALFWEHEGNAAVRVGDWKLVRFGPNGPRELYNLQTDRTELHDLSAEQPDRAKELAARWDAWAERTNVNIALGRQAHEMDWPPYPGPHTTRPLRCASPCACLNV